MEFSYKDAYEEACKQLGMAIVERALMSQKVLLPTQAKEGSDGI